MPPQTPSRAQKEQIQSAIEASFGPNIDANSFYSEFHCVTDETTDLLSTHAECTTNNAKSTEKATTVLKIVDLLCNRGSLSNVAPKKYLSALLWKADPELLRFFFDALQMELLHIQALYLDGKIPCEIAKIRVNNILCYFAYTQPNDIHRTNIQIPIFKEEHCSLEHYTIEPIELTRPWMRFLASPYYAYGLKPTNPEAPPQLLFMGTTYPAARGSLWTYVFDLIPGLSVGRTLFLIGKSRIKKWLDPFSNQTVSCHGQSLGGSLSIFTAEAFPNNTHAYADVPAGRLFYKQSPFKGGNVTVYMQGLDPISKMGSLPSDATYYYTVPEKKTTSGIGSKIFSHAASLIGNPHSILLKVNPNNHEWQSKRRSRWTAFLVTTSLIAAPLLLTALIINTVFRTISSPFYKFYRNQGNNTASLKSTFTKNLQKDSGTTKHSTDAKPVLLYNRHQEDIQTAAHTNNEPTYRYKK